MPVHGLPMMLECLINNILEESHLSSYKVAGNKERTTLVLRFDVTAMADMCVSTNHSTPARYRRKSPSQVRRDKLRQQQHREKLTSETTTVTTNTDFVKDNETTDAIQQTDNNNTESSPSIDSAIQSLSSSTLTSPVFDTPVVENTAIEKSDQHIMATETKHSKRNKHVSDTDSEAEDDNENTACDGNSRPTTEDPQDDCNTCNTAHTSLTDSDTINLLDCEETRIEISKIKKDIRKLITQPDRNNRLLKLVLDKYQPTRHAIIAETDDFILDYSIPDQRLAKFIVKNSEDDNIYTKMRKRHISNWPDQTILIWEDYGYDNHVRNIRSLLPHLKQLIIKRLSR